MAVMRFAESESFMVTAAGTSLIAHEAPARAAPRPPVADPGLRGFSDDRLAAELQRRGWIVVEP